MFEEPEYVTSQTDDIVISACPTLVEENRRAQEFLWGYYLRIENNSAKKIQLLGKNWNVTDSFGNRFCDDSAGIKVELPELEPGECFEFSSMMPLNAADAVFYGSCKIQEAGQKTVNEIKIQNFSLSAGTNAAVALN